MCRCDVPLLIYKVDFGNEVVLLEFVVTGIMMKWN